MVAFVHLPCGGECGNGIRIAPEVGAATAGNFGSYYAEPLDPRSGVSEPSVFVFPYGILVNKDGSRVVDEATGSDRTKAREGERRLARRRLPKQG